MPEPFKNNFNPKMIAQMGDHLARANPSFDADAFTRQACNGLQELELKQRSNQIKDALVATLGDDLRSAYKTMVDALHPVEDAPLGDLGMDEIGIRGWPIMPMADVVAELGMDDFDHSLDVLGEMTKRFSAEFAIRPFFIKDWRRTLDKAHLWALSGNFHLRRFASEGSRPRLPWGLQIGQFVDDPKPLVPLLEKLRSDDEEYVRRSVANNVNDIAKDHPDLVADLATDWMKTADKNTTRLVTHACRTLIKRGHAPTLAALGYGKPQITAAELRILSPDVVLGTHLEFELDLTSDSDTAQPLVIDFVIHYRMANGGTSPKVYKWKNLNLAANKSVSLAKRFALKQITTRTFYAGEHGFDIQINGETIASDTFNLTLQDNP